MDNGVYFDDVPYSELSFIRKSYTLPDRFSVTLRVFVDHDAPGSIRSLISGRPVEPGADSDSCFSLARKWLDQCRQNHTQSCHSSTASEMPTCVIDIGPPNGPIEPRLYITKGRCGSWMALSHCWGREAHFVTDSDNISRQQTGIPLSDIPPTFLDAMHVTRKLGQRYIWIDSLCIIQDSWLDWARESTRMHDYYKHSFLTIASDAAIGDHEGFLTVSRSLETPVRLGVHLPGVVTSEVHITKENIVEDFRTRPTFVSSRAWTLQEDLLSPRTLHYTLKQLVWQCKRHTYCEADVNPLHNEADLKYQFLLPPVTYAQPKLPFASVYSHRSRDDFEAARSGNQPVKEDIAQLTSRWYRIHRDYASRLLTFQDDKLPAISGIAREIQKRNGFTFKAGIWIEDISRGLAWDASGTGKQPEQYRAPSWSWAALDAQSDWSPLMPGATYTFYPYEPRARAEFARHRAKVLACEIVSRDGDPYGCVESGYIRLRGWMRMLDVTKQNGITPPYFSAYWTSRGRARGHFLRRYDQEKINGRDELILHFDIFPPDSDESTVNLKNVSMFQLSTWDWTGFKQDRNLVTIALLLEPADDLGNFRRVGIAQVPNYNGLADDGWEIADVTII